MATATYNYTHRRGDTTAWRVRLWDDDNAPLPLQLEWLNAWLVTDPADPVGTYVESLTIALLPAAGVNVATLTILPASTLDVGTYYYDFEVAQSATAVWTPVAGVVTVVADITDGVHA